VVALAFVTCASLGTTDCMEHVVARGGVDDDHEMRRPTARVGTGLQARTPPAPAQPERGAGRTASAAEPISGLCPARGVLGLLQMLLLLVGVAGRAAAQETPVEPGPPELAIAREFLNGTIYSLSGKEENRAEALFIAPSLYLPDFLTGHAIATFGSRPAADIKVDLRDMGMEVKADVTVLYSFKLVPKPEHEGKSIVGDVNVVLEYRGFAKTNLVTVSQDFVDVVVEARFRQPSRPSRSLLQILACAPAKQACPQNDEYVNKQSYTVTYGEDVRVYLHVSGRVTNFYPEDLTGSFEGYVDPIVTLPDDEFLEVDGALLPTADVFDVLYSQNLPEPAAAASALAALAALAALGNSRRRRRRG
jgi:hypothetical protein